MDPAAGFDDTAGRLREAVLAVFRVVDRAVAFGLDLALFMGSSEFARRHPPHHLSPAPAKRQAGPDPEAGLSRFKSPQQRSVQARMPVNSEQDCCWLGREVGMRWSYGPPICTISGRNRQ
jgi:hypothetical protein